MRRGVSLLEVLFAIMVTTIGLLGSLAILPAASSQARKGRNNDAVAVLGPRAFHEFDARGWRQVANWQAWNQVANDWQPYTPQFGESICIDPRFIAANASTPVPSSVFPYVPAIGNQVRMHRLTLNRGDGVEMGKLLADTLFTFDDDLAYTRPDDNSLAPVQTFDEDSASNKIRRLSSGEFSWLATLTPKVNRYSVSAGGEYVLSVVVFHQRPADLAINDPMHERAVDITFPGGGITGGEVLLSTTTGVDLSKVKANDWLLVMGRSRQQIIDQATGTLSMPIPRFQWYRVSDTEAEDEAGQRYATLQGQDWDTTCTDTQAMLIEGVVGVYEKTVRLE